MTYAQLDYAQQQRNPAKHLAGIAFVVIFHVALIYGLMNGLARKVVEVVKGPLETRLIEEVKKAPPPDKPPPPPPKLAPPPPPFIPPPEVNVAAVQQANPGAITAIARTLPPAPEPAPAPVVAAPPKASVRALLSAYNLEAGDVVRIDAGAYTLSANIVITSDDAGVKLEGYHDPAFPARHATLNRANTAAGSFGIELQNADNVTLDNLFITGGVTGVFASSTSDSDNVTISNCSISHNLTAGVEFQVTNDNLLATGNDVFGSAALFSDQQFGLRIFASGSTLSPDGTAGYAIVNDVSARDWQLKKDGKQWMIGKTFDTFAPAGPVLVTKDEIPDPHNLGIRLRLNGQTMQDSSTKQLIFGAPELLAYMSQVFTLEPGDLIYTGTPPGVGVARKPPVYLKAGDVVEVEIDGLGVLRNPVVAGG